MGLNVGGPVARELVRNARAQSDVIRIDGRFGIMKVDSSNPEYFKVRVRGIDERYEFDATVAEEDLTPEMRDTLKTAEWSHSIIFLRVNAVVVRGTIKRATILSASPARV